MLLGVALLSGLVIAFAGIGLSMWSTSAMRGVFSASDRSFILSIAGITWTTAGVAMIASALTAVHHTEGSFFLPAITPACLYVGMIAAMEFSAAARSPMTLVWGTLAGTIVSALALLPKALPSIRPVAVARHTMNSLGDGVGRIGLVVIANCAFSGMPPVEAFLAPRFGTGALSYLGYSQRLIIAMGTVIVAGPLVLLVPAIAQACVDNDAKKVKTLSVKSIGTVCVLGALVSLVFGVLRVPLIRLVLQHGAFDPRTTAGVAGTLPWMLVGSIAMIGTQVAFRAFYGQNLHLAPAIGGLLVLGLYFGLGTLFSSAIGFQGICVAYAVSWWLILGGVLALLFGLAPRQLLRLADIRVLTILVAVAAVAVVTWSAEKMLLPAMIAPNGFLLALRFGAVVVLGLIAFTLIARSFWPIRMRNLIPALRSKGHQQ
jgi:putative peptidoglycan lipid II flippase